ncbi:MAG: YbaB/EbfC family nucleoid-associated protein [Eggerthellaceae bacterium]|nr:YbaB/EbfC family nucleoid-associated protein [Eggerthellaceae bacterium]
MDMRQMMKQAQKMQLQMARVQEELKALELEGSAGGGMVKAVANGEGRIVSISINPDAVDPDDVEMLEDMVLAAVNDALTQIAEESNARMGAVTGNMRIPGMM